MRAWHWVWGGNSGMVLVSALPGLWREMRGMGRQFPAKPGMGRHWHGILRYYRNTVR
jgi:hypothetical protein